MDAKTLRTRRLITWVTIAIVTVCVLGAALVAFFAHRYAYNKNTVSVYYLRREDGVAIPTPERYLLTEEVKQPTVRMLMVYMLANPLNSELSSPFPEGTRILSTDIREGVAYIDLSRNYKKLTAFHMNLADCCIVRTLVGVENVHGVVIRIEGEPHPLWGERVLRQETFATETEFFHARTVEAVLYQPELKDGVTTALQSYRRELTVYADQNEHFVILQAILQGIPGDEVCTGVRFEGAGCNSTVLRDGTLYADLCGSFFEDPERAFYFARMIRALVASLTELQSVENVMFTFNGQTVSNYGGIRLDQPLNRNAVFPF